MNFLPTYKQQQGVTLAVTLVFLFVLLVVGGSAVRISLVEEKMSGNQRDKHIAFEAAESALVSGEDWLDSLLEYRTPTDQGTDTIWALGTPGTDKWWRTNNATWWAGNTVGIDGNSLQHAPPRYIVEERAFVQKGENLIIGAGDTKQGKYYYQITSRGHGGGENTRVHLRSTFIKRFD